jgi:anti-sigma factor RsiW
MKLDSELKRYYDSKTMDPARLDRLVRTATAPNRSVWVRLTAMAAAAVVLIATGWVFRYSLFPTPSSELAQSIAQHVVFYHEEPMPLTVRTSDLATVTMEMPRLTFTPRASAEMDTSQYHLYGARYCHIQGDLALHMRLTRDDGQSVTMYQVKDDPKFDVVDGVDVEVNGYRVRMWRENGLLMCLAEKITTDV